MPWLSEMNITFTFILSMLASIRSCWIVLLAWAILLELCILDDIFDYLHRPENKWKVDFDMPAEDQLMKIHELHTT